MIALNPVAESLPRPDARLRTHLVCSAAAAEDPRLVAWLEERSALGLAPRTHVAANNDEATAHAIAAVAEGAEAVLAAGGDGTVNAVVQGLMHTPGRAALGILPLGTANDAALSLGLPADATEALAQHAAGALAPRPVDLIRCNDSWFLNVASIGPAAALTRDTPRGLKQMLGGLAYVAYGLTQLGQVQPFPAVVHGPGLRWEGDALAIYVGNGEYAGGAFRVCPDAEMADGCLDVLLIPAMDAGNLIALFGDTAVLGDARLHEFVEHHRLAAVQIELPPEIAVNLDGEPLEAHRLTCAVHPGALSVLLPEEA